MATKPNLTEHISLLFEIYNRIPHSRKVTAQELQHQLSETGLVRDIRTIQRNLEILVKHLSIKKDTRDRPYGYHRDSLPLKTFGSRESILLHLAESWLIHSFPIEYKATINSVFTEIHNVKTRASSSTKSHRPPFALVSAKPLLQKSYSASFNAIFEQLCQGVTNQNIVNIVIEEKELVIEPLCIWVQEQSLIVIYQHPKENYQHIEIEKIQKATVSTFTFETPTEPGFLKYLQNLDSSPPS